MSRALQGGASRGTPRATRRPRLTRDSLGGPQGREVDGGQGDEGGSAENGSGGDTEGEGGGGGKGGARGSGQDEGSGGGGGSSGYSICSNGGILINVSGGTVQGPTGAGQGVS